MLRGACALDVPAILALEDELFTNSMTERMLHHELTRGWGWVVESIGGIVGYVLVRKDGELLDITRLGIREGARGQGFAQKLMEQVLSAKKDVMLTVQKDNEAAIRLYRKYGFEVVGHLVAANAWVMRLRASGS